MSTQTTPSGDTSIGAAAVTRKMKSRVSWIWLIPVVAAAIGLSLVVRTWMQAGPEITIRFRSAEGLEVGKTQVRYKDVTIGTVNNIQLSPDRSTVLVRAELIKEVASLASEGSSFWVVRPRLGVSGISGLSTLLSGAYIGVDASLRTEKGKAGAKFDFVGLENPPSILHDREGKRFKLTTKDLGSLDVGSPVYFRRIAVGRVISYELDSSGGTVNLQIFVDAPNDKFVTRGTRFWNASGIDVAFNQDGLQVRTQSLASLVQGGVAFESVSGHDTVMADADASFALYGTEVAAKTNPDGDPVQIRMRFDQSVRGLHVGSSVDFNGMTLGEVVDIDIAFDSQQKRFYAVVDAQLYPERLGQVYDVMRARAITEGVDPSQRLVLVMLKYGLRAQLRTASLLTGQLYVQLDHAPGAKPVEVPWADPLPVPTIPGSLDQLQQQISSILTKIEKVPFEQLGDDLRATLTSTTQLMRRVERDITPQAQAILSEAKESLAKINALLASDSSLPMNADRALQETARAARSLRSLADFLQSNPEALLRGRGADPIPGRSPVERK